VEAHRHNPAFEHRQRLHTPAAPGTGEHAAGRILRQLRVAGIAISPAGPARGAPGLSSISGSIRCRELRFASSTVGCTASIGPGAWWMTKPIQLLPASVAPTCAAFMNTTRCAGWLALSASMIARMYGVRSVR
jgi:hypothetical protein